jgi:hypothetical protein
MARYEPQCVDPALGELLVDHASGRLAPPERARFEAHLACCLACSDQLAPMHRLLQAIGSLSPDDADLPGDPPPRRPSLFGGAPALLAVAATVALLALGLAWQRARDVAVVHEIRDLEARLARLERQGDEILRAVDEDRSPESPVRAAYTFVVPPNL